MQKRITLLYMLQWVTNMFGGGKKKKKPNTAHKPALIKTQNLATKCHCEVFASYTDGKRFAMLIFQNE